MMSYPQAKAWTEKNWAKYAIYGPATLVSLVILYVIIMNPTATGGLNVFVNIMFGVFVVYYFGAAMVAMFQSFSKATPAERESQGLTLMLAGVIVGLLPVTIGSLIAIFAPQAVLPGQDFYFMTLVLIPIALSMAVMKKAGPAAEAQDERLRGPVRGGDAPGQRQSGEAERSGELNAPLAAARVSRHSPGEPGSEPVWRKRNGAMAEDGAGRCVGRGAARRCAGPDGG